MSYYYYENDPLTTSYSKKPCTTKDGTQGDVYKIKAKIDALNCRIAQVSHETGTTLAPILFDDEGMKTIWWDGIVELDHPEDLHSAETMSRYHTYAWHKLSYYDFCWDINLHEQDLEKKCTARKEHLHDFQRTWEMVKDHGDGVQIQYRFVNVKVNIPLETIAKYQLHIDKPGSHYDEKQNLLILRYAYGTHSCTALDNLVYYLGWKVDEYHKAKVPKNELAKLGIILEHFEYWEKQTFPAFMASS